MTKKQNKKDMKNHYLGCLKTAVSLSSAEPSRHDMVGDE